MTRLSLSLAFLLCLILVCPACRRSSAPPPPLPIGEVPSELQKAFAKAPAATKEIAAKLAQAVQEKDYTGAYQGIQFLANQPDITKQQQTITARSMLAIAEQLREAQAKGDAAASEVLRSQRISK